MLPTLARTDVHPCRVLSVMGPHARLSTRPRGSFETRTSGPTLSRHGRGPVPSHQPLRNSMTGPTPESQAEISQYPS